MNIRVLVFALSFAAPFVMAQPDGVPPGPPAVEITGTVDTNVTNTPDVRVVNEPTVQIGNDGSSPVPVTIQNGAYLVEYHWVGHTTYQDDGDFQYGGLVGIAAMNKACVEDFGVGARAANILEAYTRNDASGDPAWLVPGGLMVVHIANGDPRNGWITADATTGQRVSSFSSQEPLVSMQSAYCYQFTSAQPSNLAPYVKPDGDVSIADCERSTFAVACSAPVALPVRP